MQPVVAVRGSLERVGEVMVCVAGWAYLGIAVLICGEILGRSYFHFSLPAVTEIASYVLAIGITWGLASALTTKAHIRIEAVIEMLHPVPRAYLHTVAVAMLACMALFLTWASWLVIQDAMLFHARDTSVLSIPLLIPQAPWAFGLAVFACLSVSVCWEACVYVVRGMHGRINERLGPRTADELSEEVIEAL